MLRKNAHKNLITIVLISLFLFSCGGKIPPVAEKGLLDLNNWDFDKFDKDETVELKGEWKFKWMGDKKGDKEEEFIQQNYDDSNWNTITVRGAFKNASGKNSGFGHGWLRLKVTIKNKKGLGVYIEKCNTAYNFYVNDKLLAYVGETGMTGESPKPRKFPLIIPIPEFEGDSFTIAWMISNYDINKGGPYLTPILGNLDTLRFKDLQKTIQDSVILGIVLMMGIYHILLWFGRREDRASLYFGFFCLIIFCRVLTTNYFLERLFPSVYIFDLTMKIEYLTIPLGWTFFLTFLSELFPNDINKNFLKFFQISGILLSLFTIFTRPALFSFFIPGFQIILVFSSTWAVTSIILAVKHKREFARIVLFGFIILFFTVVHDVLITFVLGMKAVYISQIGLVFFIFFKSTILSNRFARAYSEAEHLKINLQEEVLKKTEALQTRTQEVEEANDRLKEMDHHKSEFYQNISHEFRTPLSLILGPMDNILSGKYKNKPEEFRRQCEIVINNANRVLELINQILELSKLDAGRMQLCAKHLNLVELLEYITSEFESMAKIRNINYNFSSEVESVKIYVDMEKIEKVFLNIIANAFKFTGDGGEISVKLSIVSTENRECFKCNKVVEVSVKDNGIGIPEDKIAFIFDRFWQVDGSSTREKEGTGIGLSLAKEYVKLHHGEIKVESQIGKGSIFRILLPMGKDHLKPNEILEVDYSKEEQLIIKPKMQAIFEKIGIAENFNDVVAHPSGEKILIVEDNREMRRYIKDILNENFQLFEAENGEEGLKIVKEVSPDLIISDIMMPKMDGNEFLRYLKNNDDTKDIPFIILTAKVSEDLKINGLVHGADDYLSKPFNPKELLARVNNLLKMKSHEKKIEELNKRLTEDVLKRYLPPTLVDEILAGKISLKNEPDNTLVTILFTDIVGFTRLTEKLRANKIARIINEYLDLMYDVIFEHDGTIDKFIGDSIMVIFGAPISLTPEKQAKKAVSCALAMQSAMKKLNNKFKKDNIPEINMRIGIHQGPATVGNFGGKKRFDYTAIGPTINMASRIQAKCEPGEVFVSEVICDYLLDSFKAAGSFKLKGIENKMTLYRII